MRIIDRRFLALRGVIELASHPHEMSLASIQCLLVSIASIALKQLTALAVRVDLVVCLQMSC